MHLIPYITKLMNDKIIAMDDVRLLTPKYAMIMVKKQQVIIKRMTHKGVSDVLVLTNKDKEILAIGNLAIVKFIKKVQG